jgi:hypothetical protein
VGELLVELHAAGLRPYLELEQGEAGDPLRLYCELDEERLLDLSITGGAGGIGHATRVHWHIGARKSRAST